MPPALKDALAREAKKSGRSLNQELLARLQASLDKPPPADGGNGYTLNSNIDGYGDTLSASEQLLFDLFRRMPPEKQLALLALFR